MFETYFFADIMKARSSKIKKNYHPPMLSIRIYNGKRKYSIFDIKNTKVHSYPAHSKSSVYKDIKFLRKLQKKVDDIDHNIVFYFIKRFYVWCKKVEVYGKSSTEDLFYVPGYLQLMKVYPYKVWMFFNEILREEAYRYNFIEFLQILDFVLESYRIQTKLKAICDYNVNLYIDTMKIIIEKILKIIEENSTFISEVGDFYNVGTGSFGFQQRLETDV